MSSDPNPSVRRLRTLPARPNLEHLKNQAKQRPRALRQHDPLTKLAAAQLAVAREYGFASWRRLKAQVDKVVISDNPDIVHPDRKRVFDAARAGDVETVRRAFQDGFDPAAIDDDGLTIHQIGKENRHEAIEMLARDAQVQDTRPPEVRRTIDAILEAANQGRADELRRLLDARPDLINAHGGNFQRQAALHKAACGSRHECVRLLLERGADVRIRWCAIALDRAGEVREFVSRDPSLLHHG